MSRFVCKSFANLKSWVIMTFNRWRSLLSFDYKFSRLQRIESLKDSLIGSFRLKPLYPITCLNFQKSVASFSLRPQQSSHLYLANIKIHLRFLVQIPSCGNESIDPAYGSRVCIDISQFLFIFFPRIFRFWSRSRSAVSRFPVFCARPPACFQRLTDHGVRQQKAQYSNNETKKVPYSISREIVALKFTLPQVFCQFY